MNYRSVDIILHLIQYISNLLYIFTNSFLVLVGVFLHK